MVRIYGLLSVAYFVFFLYCLLDVVLSEPSLIRNLPKLAWVFIVLIVPLAGGIAWLVAGRPEQATAAPGSTRSRGRGSGRNASTRGNGARRRSRSPRSDPPPMGPEDDPDFLRRLDEQLRDQGTDDDA